jgi:DNA-binding NarL/FixJ family response regulator
MKRVSEKRLLILELVAKGFTAREIAEATGLTTKNIAFQVRQLKHILEAKNTPHLIYEAVKKGLIQ